MIGIKEMNTIDIENHFVIKVRNITETKNRNNRYHVEIITKCRNVEITRRKRIEKFNVLSRHRK